ncbi:MULTISPECIES: DNA-3-methyladenine glycosylase family protein [Actinomadura]|uniref:DNA-3-methyladenine glycosylase II n=1 Tax=Actinomadura yumaensis TaxID=111807 RepID=A0ABW2CUW9_9ACTN|nr:DNA-3-methyladenine glycosylase 2 family protein [Actinomadura sp. J1-007]MWK39514.1 DNA-3-methyladenine glycosylase 2 family protein [Actinomadura sp. J1-007]
MTAAEASFAEPLVLSATAPFDFGASLRFVHGFPPTAGEQAVAGQTLTRALRVAGRTVVARLAAGGEGLACTLHSTEPLEPDIVEAAADRLSFYLSLDDDLRPFYEIGREDPAFAPVVDRLHGYHQVKFPTPLENVVWAILSQRTVTTRAATEKRALAEEFGDRLALGGEEYTAFPDAEQLASLPPGRMAELVGNQRKGRYLHGAVRAWLDLDEEFLRHGPYAQVKDLLLGLPGVGPWSATFVLIRGLGRTEEIPVEKGLRAAASRAYGRDLADADLQKIADGYGPWQGYWAHYLRVWA